MSGRRAVMGRVLLAALVASVLLVRTSGAQPDSALPSRLDDAAFWALSASLSEPDGYFRSENLVSNEHTFQHVVPELERLPAGGVYLGVAPDQNFTYILATRPQMAFIVDVRRGNLLVHLLYKAIFELSADRAEFLSRLFSKPRPVGLGVDASVESLFAAYAPVATSERLYRANAVAVTEQLVRRHGFTLTPEDLERLEAVYFAFFWEGPGLRYSVDQVPGFGGRGSRFPTYEELMMETDSEGEPRGYLSSEAKFRTLKQMQERNLIVPVVGNFAGPKAIRGVAGYVRERGGVVSAFYVSNVEQYLFQDRLFEAFVRNVEALPVDESSVFIRSVSTRFGYAGTRVGPDGRATSLYPIRAFGRDYRAGRLGSYLELNQRSP